MVARAALDKRRWLDVLAEPLRRSLRTGPTERFTLIDGWMLKRGAGFPYSWRPCYVCFDGRAGTLRLYDPTSAKGEVGELRSSEHVTGIGPVAKDQLGLLVATAAIASERSPRERRLKGAARSGPLLRLRAPTADDCQRWLQVISDYLAS